MRLAEHKQTPPPANNETVFAAALQGRLGLHPRGGLDAGKMATLSQERARGGGGAGREGLEGADAGGCRERRAVSRGEAGEAPEGTSCT